MASLAPTGGTVFSTTGVKVYWNDSRLRAAVSGAFRAAATASAAVAQAKKPASSIGIELTIRGDAAWIKGKGPLAHLFEHGAGAHTIGPDIRKAMKFPSGGFARGGVRHPGMRPEPFLAPAAAVFPGLFRSRAARMISG